MAPCGHGPVILHPGRHTFHFHIFSSLFPSCKGLQTKVGSGTHMAVATKNKMKKKKRNRNYEAQV